MLHRTNQYLNNRTEQEHRGVKQRYYPMLGFGSYESAARFCTAFDELRQYFRVRRRGDIHFSLAERRRLFVARWHSLLAEMAAAWLRRSVGGSLSHTFDALRSDRSPDTSSWSEI